MGKSDLPQSRFQSSRLSRLLKVGKSLAVATGHLAAEKVSDFVKDKNDAIHELSEDVKASAARVKAAQEIIQSMGHLKGGLMKIGQMISITEDLVLPKEISSLFKSLQQHAPAMTQNELSRVFRRNFQDLPEKVFKSFDYSPIAAASIGQVHRATLHSGEEVAVKIQYPDIVNAIKSDLQNIDQLDRLFGAIFPSKPHIRPMLEELKNTLIDECNYHKELENLNFFRNAFDREFNGKVKIPKTFEAFSTLEILTTELVKGSSFEETLSWPQQDRDSLGEITYNSFLFSFFSLNALHTDPQNGNYLFNKDQIIIMDFGSVKFFSQEFVRYYTGILISIEKHDMRLFRVCALNLRMIRENDSAEYIQKQFDLIEKIYRPFLGNGIFPIQDLNPFYLIKEFFNDISLSGKSAPHPDFLLMDRANIGLFSKLKYWGSSINWEHGRELYRYQQSQKIIREIQTIHPELELGYER